MLDQLHPAPVHPAEVYARGMFRRVLASWVLDCSRLHRKGLLRPCMRPGTLREEFDDGLPLRGTWPADGDGAES